MQVEALALQAALASFLVLLRLIWPPGFAPVYLIDFYTYRPPDRSAKMPDGPSKAPFLCSLL